jgi:antitoxin HigA-1
MKGAGGNSPRVTNPDGADDDVSIHPGFLLRRDVLEPSGLTEQALARRLGVSIRTLSEIVCGKRPITRRTARKLESAFGHDAEVWLVRQARHSAWEEHQHRQQPPNGTAPRREP